MPTTTSNLGLKLYGDSSELFMNFRTGVAGEGSGENKSNMQKIDDFAGTVAGKAMLITISENGGTYSADKTFSEIATALTAGTHVFLTDGEGLYYSLRAYTSGSSIAFIAESFTDQTHYCYTITNTETVTRTSWAGGGGGTYHGMPISNTVAWGYETPAGSTTPDITLPNVPNPRTEATELVYIFTAASANADFTPPSAYILGDEEDGFAGMDPGDTISYTNLTIGSIYEISFKVLDSTHISLIKKEHKTA